MQRFHILLRKIKYRISQISSFRTIDLSELAIRLFLILIIIALSYNIFNAYNRGRTNKLIIEEEEKKLEALLAESQELDKELEYFNSLEYQRIYARDSQNLAEPGESLYFILRDIDEQEKEYLQETDDPLTLDNNWKWWRKLLLGI